MLYWIAVHNWYEIGLYVWLEIFVPDRTKVNHSVELRKGLSLSRIYLYISPNYLDFWLSHPTYTYIYILGFPFIYIAIYFVYITTQSMYMFHFPEYPRREHLDDFYRVLRPHFPLQPGSPTIRHMSFPHPILSFGFVSFCVCWRRLEL